ncbi:uncharacterized protein METZ01_LOCUS447283, partial [marine metagenome]
GSPFASIQSAINFAVTDGDSVAVAAGTYVENINFRGRNIKVVGEDRETTIIDGNQSQRVVSFLSGETQSALFENFTLTNGLGGLIVSNSSPTLNRLKIIGNDTPYHGGGINMFNSNPRISNVLIANNTGNPGGGLNIDQSQPAINNSNILNNYGSGGIQVNGGSVPEFINSVLGNNQGAQIYINPDSDSSTVNISYSNILGGIDDFVITNDNGTINWGDGNIDVDPMFVDTANGDYNLLADSRLIDAGHPDSTDADG